MAAFYCRGWGEGHPNGRHCVLKPELTARELPAWVWQRGRWNRSVPRFLILAAPFTAHKRHDTTVDVAKSCILTRCR